MIDTFSDSDLGAPMAYAQCELIPGSDTPMSLPVFSVPSGFSARPDQYSIQTVLALGTSSHPDGVSSAATPPMDMEDGPLLETGLPGCPFRFTPQSRQPFADGNPAFGLQLHHPRFLEFVDAPRSALLLYHSPTFRVDQLGKEQALDAAVNLQRDAGIMLSNLQILSQFAMSLSRMSSDMMDLGIGQMVFPHDEVAGLSPTPRAAKYMSAMGLWRPQTGPEQYRLKPAGVVGLVTIVFRRISSIRSSVYSASASQSVNRWPLDEGAGSSSCSFSSSSVMHSRTFAAV